MADQLCNGCKFRSLTIVDYYRRQCLAIEVDKGFKAVQVVAAIERFKAQHRRVAKGLKVDYGSKFSQKSWTSGPMIST